MAGVRTQAAIDAAFEHKPDLAAEIFLNSLLYARDRRIRVDAAVGLWVCERISFPALSLMW